MLRRGLVVDLSVAFGSSISFLINRNCYTEIANTLMGIWIAASIETCADLLSTVVQVSELLSAIYTGMVRTRIQRLNPLADGRGEGAQ